MSITVAPMPVLLTGLTPIAALLALLILLTAFSPAVAQRLIRLLNALHHLIHGTCQYCDRKIKTSNRRLRRTRRG